ncbi:MAG: NAD(P)-binding domain-containing protein, partial [Rhodoglobus sp.]
MRLGVVGLGRMGLPIARNLVSAGFNVSVHDTVDERMLAAAPARAVSDAVELAASVDVLITVLPGAPEVEKFMTAEVIAALDGVWLDLTSNDPRVAERIAALGVEAVGAPMG